MPLLPNAEPQPDPWWSRTAVIAAVGAFVASIANLICYLAGAGPEVYALVSGVVGAGLAVWRSASGGGGPGPLAVAFVLAVAGLGGCASTLAPVQRDGIATLTSAGVRGLTGTLRVLEHGEAADLVELGEPGIVLAVAGAVEYPCDTGDVARGIVTATVAVLVDLGQDTAARLVAVLEPVVKWALDQALGATKPTPAASASGGS